MSSRSGAGPPADKKPARVPASGGQPSDPLNIPPPPTMGAVVVERA